MKKLFAIVLLICFVSTSALATVPKSQDDFFYDEADVLSYEVEGVIFYNNQALEKACGSEIVVAAVKTTGYTAIDEYAYRMFNEWEVGDKKKDNGFLLLLSIEDEDAFLCQGTGAERIIDAGGITRMMDEYLKDDFFAKRYSDGVLKIFEALFTTVRDFYGINLAFMDEEALTRAGKLDGTAEWDSAPKDRAPKADKDSGNDTLSTILGAIIVIAIIVAIVSRPRRRGAVRTGPTVIVTPSRPARTTRTYRPRSGSFSGWSSTPRSSGGWSSGSSSRSTSSRSGSGFSSGSSSRSSSSGSRGGFSGGRTGGGSSRGSGGGFSRGR